MRNKNASRAIHQAFVIFILFLLLRQPIPGADNRHFSREYLVDSWEISDGLPSNTIKSIAQTPDGYLWFSSERGLVRFDGIKFTVVSFHPQKSAIPETLYLDRKNILWIGSKKGLTSYHYHTGLFKTYTMDDGLSWEEIRCIKDDSNGNLWVCSWSNYVNRLTDNKFEEFNHKHGLRGKKINSIVEYPRDTLLFGTRDQGLYTYKDGRFSRFIIKGIDNFNILTILRLDSKKNLWIGTSLGLFKTINNKTVKYTTKEGLPDNHIADVLEDSRGSLWIGTIAGLVKLKEEPADSKFFDIFVTPLQILCLFEDREKNLWIGTHNAGIKRLKKRRFLPCYPLKDYSEQIFFSIYQDQDRDTWIGTASGKLFHCRENEIIEIYREPELSGIGIAAITGDKNGTLWLGTTGKGIYRKKKNTFTQVFPASELPDSTITSLFIDSREQIYCATFNGVSIIHSDKKEIQSFTRKDGLSGTVIHNIYEDKNQNIWIASDSGITVLENGETTKENIKYFLKGISVTAIYEDSLTPAGGGRLFWIATHGSGLKRLILKDNEISSLIAFDKLPSHFLYQFFEDQNGYLWIMSQNGILRINKNELSGFSNSQPEKIHVTSFGTSDGMESTEFNNGFSRNSALQSRDGRLWFITKKGVTTVNPMQVPINNIPPNVVIEEAIFDNNRISFPQSGRSYIFKGKKNVEIHFTAPTFLSPGNVKFQCRLEGLEKKWKYLQPGENRVMVYKNLPYGTFTFRLNACNADGVWNPSGNSMTFTLEPLFHQTLLFKIITSLLAILVAAVIYYTRKHMRPNREKYKSSKLHPDFVKEILVKLDYLMQVEKIYRQSDLSLNSMAERIGIPNHQLSQIINEHKQRNFCDFLNYHRIEEAQKILNSPAGKKKKISMVAQEIGFHNMTAFYNAFKKYTGKTPRQYRIAIDRE